MTTFDSSNDANETHGANEPPSHEQRSMLSSSIASSYKPRKATAPTRAQESLILSMQLRKLTRDSNGTQKKASRFHLLALLIMLAVLFGVGSSYYENGTFTTTITLTLWQIVGIGFWFLVCVIVTSVFADRHFITLLYWMLVYWPLLAMLASLLFTGTSGVRESDDWIWISLIVAEAVTLFIFVVREIVRPKLLQSQWFRENYVTIFWNVRVIQGWTMTYGRFGKRYTCKYEGDFDENSNLPCGFGQWLDDSHGGEVLTGTWKNGEPVAPFVSRIYGKGDAFRAVPLAYFMATDDEFGSNKLVPTNEGPLRCGVASVECSVQGAFYNHLPNATELYGPRVVGQEGASVQECLERISGTTNEEDLSNLVTVNARDPRGVQVMGHLYNPTGVPFSDGSSTIVIDVEREQATVPHHDKQDSSNFMPFTSFRTARSEHILIHDDEEPSELQVTNQMEDEKNGDNKQDKAQDHDEEQVSLLTKNKRVTRLVVQNWMRNPHKDALVYVPGFNSCLKKSLETLGQFVAMTKIADHVHPIIFAWPNGQVPTYRHASAISATDKNKQNFLELMHGLEAAGIHHVHFMSHSLGVQTLLGAFGDKPDGTRSDVSKCFRLDSDFDTTSGSEESSKLMMVKSITMLNPDFPIEAFVDHAFLCIRRVCNHITVVGDRGDQALFYSSFINGSMNFMGYSQPVFLNKNGTANVEKQKGFHCQRVVGRDIQSLYLPNDNAQRDEEGGAAAVAACDERLLFRGVTPIIVSPDDQLPDRHWLDIDVIDTTQLDTNIKDLRHSGFNVNPILVNDLEELIVTGRRAANRSSLLFREGNIYSYCHAPAFVTM